MTSLLHLLLWLLWLMGRHRPTVYTPNSAAGLQHCTEGSPKVYSPQQCSGGSLNQLKGAITANSLERFLTLHPPRSVPNVLELSLQNSAVSNLSPVSTKLTWNSSCSVQRLPLVSGTKARFDLWALKPNPQAWKQPAGGLCITARSELGCCCLC